jgi:hypothetical protein
VSLERVFLLATGLLFVAFGVAYLVAPVPMAALADLGVASPLAVIEMRGFYGGQLVGLGALVLLGARRSAFVAPALLLLLASLGGTALGRLVGVLASGSLPAIIAVALAMELAGALGALALWRRRRGLAA